jgi:DNA-binding response OmpR family regulator
MGNVMNLRLLLLEDDAISATFLREVLHALPAHVDHAPDLASARRMAVAGHGLWLFDARLPDGRGADLLAELRARGLSTPALALTAADDPASLQQLEAAGFAKVLRKPVSARVLLANVREYVEDDTTLPWNDAVALAALGNDEASVQALRRLFLQELPDQVRSVQSACGKGELETAREHLHRLKAGCGFVGAMRLLAAVRALDSRPEDGAALERFRFLADELLVGA